MVSILVKLVFPQPPSVLLNAMSVIYLASSAIGGFSELRGNNMPYSKFLNQTNDSPKQFLTKEPKEGTTKVPSRWGMLICYTPAFLASVAMFLLFPHDCIRMLMLKSALAFHFFKRVFEVSFIHKYSSNMVLSTAIIISINYLSNTTSMVYAQYLSQGLVEPPIDLKYIGFLLFLIGISGNFYHHYLLSQLREKGEKKYKIPSGGLFGLVICPHYLFEIIEFLGFSFISQTLHALSVSIGTMLYLVGRSYATRQWYLSKQDDFPPNVKALIPYLF
ncbi:3-oxo-5-alpha-steroid 4-dehydrogenase, C-terminal [Trema orientale]|uniref:3-oxo-5-alpha-steroid 4-dehydrogenase, C-terminal n=1 Tax=Trema orientale TaxID=63057 RepID=A0A2P5EAI4_TREOI|nr:3-oxo-5-alpha-steroid 4-dehydrogenase, C-terminal [Trema orientale]